MSVRDQERRALQAMRRSDEVRMRIDQRVKHAVHQAEEAMLRDKRLPT